MIELIIVHRGNKRNCDFIKIKSGRILYRLGTVIFQDQITYPFHLYMASLKTYENITIKMQHNLCKDQTTYGIEWSFSYNDIDDKSAHKNHR